MKNLLRTALLGTLASGLFLPTARAQMAGRLRYEATHHLDMTGGGRPRHASPRR